MWAIIQEQGWPEKTRTGTKLSHMNAPTVTIRILTGETWNPTDLVIRTLRAMCVLNVVKASSTTLSWKGTKLNVQASGVVILQIIKTKTIMLHRIRLTVYRHFKAKIVWLSDIICGNIAINT